MRILLAAPLAAVLVLGVSAPRSRLAIMTTTATAMAMATPGTEAMPGTRRGPGLTDQDFYFVMGDRFANGDPANDTGGLGGDRLVTGFDADGARASTTAATSTGCARSWTTSRGSAPTRSG